MLEPEAATTSTTTTNNSLRTRNTYANSVDTPTVSSLRSRVSSARSYVDNSSPPNVNVTVHVSVQFLIPFLFLPTLIVAV